MTCCAKCRRGTPALGEFPCGMGRVCPCHVHDVHSCRVCHKPYALKSAAETCEDMHELDADTDGTYWEDHL